jgi:hypothetical protein
VSAAKPGDRVNQVGCKMLGVDLSTYARIIRERMDGDRQRLHQRLIDFYIAYYAELRKSLPNYVSNSESKQIPPYFRTHRRYLRVMEFEDGYVIVHRTVPPEEFDQVGYWEMFNFWDYRGQTVGAATGRGYPPYGDFMEGEMPLMRNREWRIRRPRTP